MKIAVVGTGISGLGIAYALSKSHEVTIYEKNHYIGGHSRTVSVKSDQGDIPVDTGFIVFNYRNYPQLTALFEHLDVAVEKSNMSFGASIENGWLEYGSNTPLSLFAQRKNMWRPRYLQMLRDILRFNKEALKYLEADLSVTLGDCLKEIGIGQWCQRYYVLAMGASIWSCPHKTMLNFPAKTFIRFFDNHGLLTVTQQPQWYTVSGGSKSYVSKLTDSFKEHIKLSCGVEKVTRHKSFVTIYDEKGGKARYDQVVFACHADQALAMLENPLPEEKSVLSGFTYQDNDIVLHSDQAFMPRARGAWSSWIYRLATREDSATLSLSYWMNNLQNIASSTPYIVTLNPNEPPNPDLVYDRHRFRHPVFNREAVAAQQRIPSIQGLDRCWYVGAYQRYGFHEDGLLSAVNVLEKMGERIPWN